MPDDFPNEPEFFNWNGIIIRQGDRVHKIGTDAVLLGSWVRQVIPEASTILDVGTGTGVLALMMGRCFPQAYIRAIDLDQEAINFTQLNIEQAGLKDRVEVIEEDVFDQPSDSCRFDLVVCNPPYHQEHILPSEEYKQRAKHLNTLVISWMKGLCTRLTADGHLMLVIPYTSAKTWIEAANAFGFHNLDRLNVFSFEDDAEPKRTLLHFAGKLVKPNISQLVIYQKDKTYTPGYLQMTGISPTITRKK